MHFPLVLLLASIGTQELENGAVKLAVTFSYVTRITNFFLHFLNK